MDVEELISRAWRAVVKAEVPEALQPLALKEAIDHLREAENGQGSSAVKGKGDEGEKRPRRKRVQPKRTDSTEGVSEDDFFSQLAMESGVDEAVLKDVLQFKDGAVHVIPPTRLLGGSKAEQTRRVVALVAGSYAHGLDQSPVSADAVRQEAKRKRCFDPGNFSSDLKAMKGFSPGSKRTEILAGSKWLDEFNEAISAVTDNGPAAD